MPDLNFCENVEHGLARESGTIVLQPTSLCPLTCAYCYLPERHLKQEMSPVTACAIASGIPLGWSSSGPVEIVWHGGEPLAIGRETFVELIESFEPLRVAGRVQHKVQTGATLITDEWCDIFERYGMGVGVSIDGPRSANRHRLDRGEQPTFDRVIAGIDALRKHGIPFTILAVVSQDGTTGAEEILDFLADLSCPWLELNIEARESANIDGKVPTIDQARRFWRDTFTWSRNNTGMKVREFEYLLGFLGLDSAVRDADARHDIIPTIGWNGDVILLSPELLGVRNPDYHNFVTGNVLTDPLPAILERAPGLAYVQDFMVGLDRCKATCGFFSCCQGAHAGNRYFEHGTFSATETEHCKASFQAPVLALADLVNGEG
jgi:uncharacterized protein